MAVALSEEEVIAVFCTTNSAPTTLVTAAGANSQRARGNTDTAVSRPPPSSSEPGTLVIRVGTPAVNPSR
jgi:hypothetical protein